MEDRRKDEPRSTRRSGTDWPPYFPHTAIDALIERIEDATELRADEVNALLVLIADEAQRLRSTVVRLSAARLSEAEREASAIMADAHTHAETLRTLALDVLNSRVDEAEELLAAMRHAFQVEYRKARGTSAPPRP